VPHDPFDADAVQRALGVPVRAVPYVPPKVYHLPNWGKLTDAERVATLRRIVLSYGRDPRIVETTIDVLRRAGVQPREYERQCAAILAFVQTMYYANESMERLQSPVYTLDKQMGDCDDTSLLLASMLESVRLPWRFVLSGVEKATKRKVRWIEGTPLPSGVAFSHIYVMCGFPPFNPTEWRFAESTLKGAPLGWDVVGAAEGETAALARASAGAGGPSSNAFPEMGSAFGLIPFFGANGAAAAAGGSIVASQIATGQHRNSTIHWPSVGMAVVVGTATVVVSQLLLDIIRAWRDRSPARGS
jgi:hypothetical protein